MNQSLRQAHNEALSENLKIINALKYKLLNKIGQENVTWCDIGDQGFVNQQLQEIAQFIGLSPADKEQD